MKSKVYARLDAENNVIGVSNCEPTGGGTFVEVPEGVAIRLSTNKVKYSGGKFIETTESWLPQRGYAMNRASEYPSVTDQLDMLWHAMDQGLLPKIEPMYSSILAVKQKHPKPV